MRVIIEKNNQAILNANGKVVDKFVRIERIVPQIIEKVVKVDYNVVGDTDLDGKFKLLEEERALIRKEIRNEFRDKISELENNILAY